ncbi:MAG: AAA family ATPase [Bacteroidales bacterium]|nr:AAA family ATPase [Bacteroidales bacterium]
MKFQTLKIHNIASIEDAIIDFDAAPLDSSDVFLISGKTGSGKSTILDAICLALYGKTPRMANTAMQGDISDLEKKTIAVDDVRQMMRRNTAEAYVSLTFTDNGGVHYGAEWSVARARKKADGALQARKWVLTNLDTNQTYNKVNEIEAIIKEVVQLDFNQFCRTTILPQGEFTRFLNSKDNDKAEILEKITGVDVYSRIGAKIYEIADQKKNDLMIAEQQVQDMDANVLPPEELVARQETLDNLSQKLEENKAEEQRLNEKIQWLTNDQTQTKMVETARSDFEKAKNKKESESFKQQSKQVRDWTRTITARGFLKEQSEAQCEQQKQEQKLKDLKKDYMTAMSGVLYQKKHIQELHDRIDSIQAYLNQQKSKDSIYKNYQTIDTLLKNLAEGKAFIHTEKTEVASLKQKIQDNWKPASDKAESEYNNSHHSFQTEDQVLKDLDKKLSETQLPTKRENRENLLTQKQNLSGAIEALKDLEEKKSAYQQNKKTLQEQEQALTKKKSELPKALEAKQNADQERGRLKKLRDQQANTIDKWAKNIRTHLHMGDECPVCKQKLAVALPAEEVMDQLFQQAEEAFQNSEQLYRTAESDYNQLYAICQAEEKMLRKNKEKFKEDHSVDTALTKAQSACKACGVTTIANTTVQSLESQKQVVEKELVDLNRSIQDAEKLENEVKDQRKKVEQLRKEVEDKMTKWTTAKEDVTTKESEVMGKNQVIAQKETDVQKFEKEIDNYIGQTIWTNDWRTDATLFRQELLTFYNEYKANSEDIDKLSDSVGDCEKYHKDVISSMQSILGQIGSWKELTTNIECAHDNLLPFVNKIMSDVQSANTILQQAEKKAQKAKSDLNDFLCANTTISLEYLKLLDGISQEEVEQTTTILRKIEADFSTKEGALTNALGLKAEHDALKPSLSESDTLETLKASFKEVNIQEEAILASQVAITEQIKTNKGNQDKLNDFKKKRDEVKAVSDRWSRLNQFIGDAKGARFRKVAQSYVLSSLVHSANAYLKSMTDRYTLKVEPGTFVITLEDAYLGFASRSASTISGGESFIVSLALALALSDIGEQLAVDTLFIDEGFGTLSGEPLQRAVNTLRSLHSKMGRHVGIISHVEELKNSIPVQIVVNQEGLSSSSTIEVVANA